MGTKSEAHVELTAGRKWLLAALCLIAGGAALAARSIPNEGAQIAYSLVVAAILLGLTAVAMRRPALRPFWPLSFAFFVFAFVQLLNNSVPHYFLANVLHEAPVTGNPLASSIRGTVIIQLLDTALAIVPILVLVKASGQSLDSIYASWGRIGIPLLIAVAGLVLFYVVTATIPLHRLFPTNGTVTLSRFFSLSPALLVVAVSNGFQEEFLFRGLFLRRYNTFFGIHVSNVLQAVIFAGAHLGVVYTPVVVIFTLVIVFPLGLFCGYLMRKSNGIVAPAIFHGAADIAIYLPFFTYVS